MKLDIFIQKLIEIKEKEGSSMEVVMADCIPVVEPVLSESILDEKVVVITDQK